MSPNVNPRNLLRNTLFLVLSQFVTMPMGVLVNAVLARKLGADDFGLIYLASTMAGLGFLFVDWGQQATVAARVALKREEAAETLATSLALKALSVVVVSAALILCAWFLGYSRALFVALALTIVQQAFMSLSASYAAVMRGFERLDWVSGLNMTSTLLSAAMVIPVALLGGGLAGTLSAQAVAALFGLVIAQLLLSRLSLGRLLPTAATARRLLQTGGGFVVFGLVLAVQPYVDAVILSRLAPAEAVGWYAAARRLLGTLIFPATTIGFVLYPTVVRLFHENRERFQALVGSTLRLVILIGVCASLGTYLFAGYAIQVVYSSKGFGPAVADLQVLAVFVFLLYFTMILGQAVAASGKQLVWAGIQTLCIVVSAVGDPLLVPYCQRRFANGGLGVCISTVVSEILMVAGAMILLRGENVIRPLVSAIVPAIAAGAAMIGVATLLRPFHPLIGIVASCLAYVAVVIALGGVDRTHLALIKDVVNMKSRKAQATGSA